MSEKISQRNIRVKLANIKWLVRNVDLKKVKSV